MYPPVINAAVIINEIAWMGTDVSANDEWIELYNTGDTSVSVDGWVLDDGMNLEIELAGSIAAGQYAVLERTDDSSAPSSAFLIYAGALANTGATLTLKRSDGSIEDRITGGENWEQIGGDNVTKETAQYSTAGWITAFATPGKTNATSGSKETDAVDSGVNDANESQTPPVKKIVKKEKISLVLPDVELSLAIKIPNAMYVNQQVSFEVVPSGLGKVIMDSLQYEWNFGDMHTADGKDVKHTFLYPGEYLVTVRAAYARHEQIARIPITVLPVNFSMTRNLQGDLQLHNDARYEVDISGYELRGEKMFIFPPRTIMLPNATITIPKDTIGVARGTQTQLLDSQHTLAAVYSVGAQDVDQSVQKIVVSDVPVKTMALASDQSFIFSGEAEESETDTALVATSTKPAATSTNLNVSAAAGGSGGMPDEALPYLGLIGIITLGIFGVYATGARKHN